MSRRPRNLLDQLRRYLERRGWTVSDRRDVVREAVLSRRAERLLPDRVQASARKGLRPE